MKPARFAVLLAALTAALARVAFIESHWDEDAGMAIGWLLSQGVKLYSGVFSHHGPLDYLPSATLASVFGPRPAVMRGFMVLLWAALAAAVYAALRRKPAGSRAAVGFAVLSSQWLTYWHGQFLLVENLWAYAAVLAAALLGTPLSLETGRGPRRAAAFGALAALVLCASPTCLPAAFLLAAWFAAEKSWRVLWRPAALGAGAWLLFLGAWAAVHADLSLLWEHALVFNRDVYARFYGLANDPVSGFWRRALEYNAGYYASAFEWGSTAGYFEGLLKLFALSWVAWSLAEKRWAQGAWKLAFLLAVHARPEKDPSATPFHAAPFYLSATMIIASSLARLWDAVPARRRIAFAVAVAAALLPTLWATSLATDSLRRYSTPSPGYDSMVEAVRARTSPSDRVLAVPCYPRFYLDTARLPATPSVFYLPWQEAWPPQREATLAALAATPPKFVLVQDAKVWGEPWTEYGQGIEAWLKAERYFPVATVGSSDGKPFLKLLARPE